MNVKGQNDREAITKVFTINICGIDDKEETSVA